MIYALKVISVAVEKRTPVYLILAVAVWLFVCLLSLPTLPLSTEQRKKTFYALIAFHINVLFWYPMIILSFALHVTSPCLRWAQVR